MEANATGISKKTIVKGMTEIQSSDYPADSIRRSGGGWKDITVNRIRYIGKESDNIDEVIFEGTDGNSCLGCVDRVEFYNWIPTLNPENLITGEISRQSLYYQKL